MTVTKRPQAIVFAVVCAFVLIGGRLEAPAADLGSWNPIVTGSSGISPQRDVRHLYFDFHIAAMQAGEREMEICGRFQHRSMQGRELTIERCGPDELWRRGPGRFRATFIVPVIHDGSLIATTQASMKVRILRYAGGGWMESDYTHPRTVHW